MLRRDRNHPSIIMWSIGNEIPERSDDDGVEIAKNLTEIVKKYDTTRFTTAGINAFWSKKFKDIGHDKAAQLAMQHLDIAGYNYMFGDYERDHKSHPERIMYGSESYPRNTAENWNLIEKNNYIIGDFVWTAMDYLGEAGLARAVEIPADQKLGWLMPWPWYNAWCGDIDFCGEKKPQSYYRDVVWRLRDIALVAGPTPKEGYKHEIHLWGWAIEQLSWNWDGMEGKKMNVNVYSRSQKVRLYLNNKLLEEKEIDKKKLKASFEVNYAPGVLKAVNVSDDGKETSSAILKTTGKPAAIKLIADRSKINASKNDLAYINIHIVDKDGNLVPNAEVNLNIKASGSGDIRASGNAAYDDMESFNSKTPKTFRGKAIAIVQPNGKKGPITLSVTSKGLKEASITIETN